MKLHISPCPNDTFAFYALIHELVDNEGEQFDLYFDDIETLNRCALNRQADIIKASIAVLPHIPYNLLTSGAAIGHGNGPIVVRRTGATGADKRVLLPGQHTTAALLFDRYFANYDHTYTRFSNIAPMIEHGADAPSTGVLIHEGRFTLDQYRIEKIADLGELWHKETELPLPLGGIFARRDLDAEKFSRIVRRSVQWAIANPTAPLDFVRSHATEISQEVIQNHIDLFVNHHTIELGQSGLKAIELLTNTPPDQLLGR